MMKQMGKMLRASESEERITGVFVKILCLYVVHKFEIIFQLQGFLKPSPGTSSLPGPFSSLCTLSLDKAVLPTAFIRP